MGRRRLKSSLLKLRPRYIHAGGVSDMAAAAMSAAVMSAPATAAAGRVSIEYTVCTIK